MSFFQSLEKSSGVPATPSPSKKRERPTRSASLEEVKSQLDHNAVSPSKRTSEWLKAHSAATKTPKALSVKGGKVSKHPNLGKQPAKAKTNFWSRILPKFLYGQSEESHHEKLRRADDEVDSDGSTLVEEQPLSPSPAPEGDTTLAIQDDGVNVEEDILPAIRPEEDNDHFTPSSEDLRHMQHWSKDQIWLFNKLNMRGFEPLLHETWTQDFLTLPDELFSEADSEVFIKAYRGSEYNGR